MDNVNGKIIIRKQDRIDYIIDGICSYYGLLREDFGRKYVRNPQRFNAKRIAMLILYDIADCTLKDINFALDYSNGTALTNTHRHINNLREDLTYNKALNTEYKNILKHLNL